MSLTFDTLGYANHLREAGVPEEQAHAHAKAAKDYIMSELVTKADLVQLRLEMTLINGGMLVAGLSILFALLRITA